MRIRRRVMVRRRLVPRRVRTHPVTRGVVALVALLAAATTVQHLAAGVADAKHRWGEARSVVVARRRIEIGATVGADDVAAAAWPAGLVPDGAVEGSAVGRTVVAAIEPGEVILNARLAPDGLSGIAALVPDGWRALAIPIAPTVIALRPGDHVDLIAGFDVASSGGGGPPALTVARDALVIAIDDQRLTVAVRSTDAEHAAFAAVAGTVVPVLRVSGSR